MGRIISYFWLIILALGLFGCDLSRGDQSAGDIAGINLEKSVTTSPTSLPVTVQPQEFAAPPAWVNQENSLPWAVQTGTVTRIQPAAVQLNLGDVTAVEIWVDNVTDLVGVDVSLQFNPAIVQVQDANPNQDGVQIQPGNFPAPDFIVTNAVTNTVGIINYIVSELAPFQPVNGSGVVATINFQAVGQGNSAVNISRAILVNSQIQSIPNTLQPGQITVGQGPASTPTHTPVPGQATATFTPIPLPVTPIFSPTPVATPPVVTAVPTPIPTPTPLPPPTSTPSVPQVYIPPGATEGFCYRVQPGDTLKSLAYAYGTDPGFISLANDLYPPGHIYPQKVLFMPTAYGNGPNIYRVQPGNTLAYVAEQCQMKVEVLAYVNGLSVGANLDGIEWLIIPRPPFAPPSRYPYPQVGPPSVWPPPCSGSCY